MAFFFGGRVKKKVQNTQNIWSTIMCFIIVILPRHFVLVHFLLRSFSLVAERKREWTLPNCHFAQSMRPCRVIDNTRPWVTRPAVSSGMNGFSSSFSRAAYEGHLGNVYCDDVRQNWWLMESRSLRRCQFHGHWEEQVLEKENLDVSKLNKMWVLARHVSTISWIMDCSHNICFILY